jgi:hypothetical protein
MDLFFDTRGIRGITVLNIPGIASVAMDLYTTCQRGCHHCATEQRILILKVTSSFHG